MNETLITYRQVDICQQELCILEGVDLELHEGELVYLIGKVGSGKTSLLKTFYAELDVRQGEAEVLGYDLRRLKRKHLPALRRKLGIVFQDFQLLTDRTVYDNLEFVLKATGWKNRQERADRIEEVLAAAEVKSDYEEKRDATIAAYNKAKAEGTELPQLAPKWVLDLLETMGK